MSRSFDKTPNSLHRRSTDKEWKRKSNRRARHAAKSALHHGDEIIPILEEISDVWSSLRDGSHFYSPKPPEDSWYLKFWEKNRRK